MSLNNLSIDGEFRYIIQWFNEWSELQRDDFVYVFVEYLTKETKVDGDGVGGSGVYVNGVVNSLAATGVQDKPMSLFQCRIKLFRQWSAKWPVEFKGQLQERINEIDAKVGEKIINELKGPNAEHNGDVAVHLNVNGASGDNDVEQATADSSPDTAVAAADFPETLETNNDSHLAAVLRQETPVDDDDDDEQQHAGDDCNVDVDLNGYYAPAAVTTIAVNTSPHPPAGEPVEQVENASVIVSVAAASQAEVAPVA